MEEMATPLSAQAYPLVADRAALAEANELMMRFGELAITEVELRADRCRRLGNLAEFCRWRSIERTIEILSNKWAVGAIH